MHDIASQEEHYDLRDFLLERYEWLDEFLEQIDGFFNANILIKKLIEIRPDHQLLDELDTKDHDGNTPLHLAAANGSYMSVVLLLAIGADANVTNYQEQKPIDLTSSDGLPYSHALLEFIAAADADDAWEACHELFIQKLQGLTEQDMRAAQGHEDDENKDIICIDMIIESGIILPLHSAVLAGIHPNKFEFKWLTERKNVDIDAVDYRNETALTMAKNINKEEIRKNARILSQANRTGSSFFKDLPFELLVKIASFTGDPNLHNEKESEEIAYENLSRPSL